MARITRDIKTLSKAIAGLTLDVVSTGVSVAAGSATLLRDTVNATNKENLQNFVTYTADVVTGNEIGTANSKIEEATANGDFGKKVAEYVLTAVHGDADYRKEAAKIEAKIQKAESKLDKLLLQAELVTLEKDALKEIAKIEKATEAAQAQA